MRRFARRRPAPEVDAISAKNVHRPPASYVLGFGSRVLKYRVFAFAPFVPTSPKRVEDSIANLDDVRDVLRGTKWEI